MEPRASAVGRLDTRSLTPGTHHAGLWLKEDTPHLASPVDIRLDVRPRG